MCPSSGLLQSVAGELEAGEGEGEEGGGRRRAVADCGDVASAMEDGESAPTHRPTGA